MHRSLLALVALSLACAAPAMPPAEPPPPPQPSLTPYSEAMQEAADRFEEEVVRAAAAQDTTAEQAAALWPARYQELLEAALWRRGHTYAQLRRLSRQNPRFYFTQQALYADRLERLRRMVESIADRDMIAEQ